MDQQPSSGDAEAHGCAPVGVPNLLGYKTRSTLPEMMPWLSAEIVLRRAGYACLADLAHHEQAARTGEAESIHRMRVAVRRWRATISAFGPLIPQRPRRAASNELRWIAVALSEARNLDVFVSAVLAPARAAISWSSELERLAASIDRRRRAAHAAAKTAISSERYGASVQTLADWLDNREWRSDGDAAALLRPIGELAPLLLSRRHRQAQKQGASFAKQSEAARHQLRITLKKLRYTAELVGDLYEGATAKEFVRSLKQLQDDLGDINDVSVARDIIASLADPAQPKIGIDHAGRRIIAWHKRRLAGNEAMLRKRVRQLFKIEPFWMYPLTAEWHGPKHH